MKESFNIYEFVNTMKNITPEEIWDMLFIPGCIFLAAPIVQARIPKVVIGCMNPKAGCAGSVLDMLHEDGFNHQVETEVGLLGEECSQMLKDFFKALREEGKRKKLEQVQKEANKEKAEDKQGLNS